MSRWVVAGVVALVVLGGAGWWLWGRPAAAPETVVEVSASACGHGWSPSPAGPQTLLLRNTGAVIAEAEVVDPATGAVFGEVEGLGAGATRALDVTLDAGDYALRCLPDDADAVTGPVVHLTGGTARRAPAVIPVTYADLIAPAKAYHDATTAGLDTLTAQTDALATAVGTGNRDAARAAWLAAHLTYERLGAAYGAFGDADSAINGTADGLPGGIADPGFTGFHRLEYGLWHDEPAAALTAVARQLDDAVHRLRESFPDTQIDQHDLGLRAHEIMENALQSELTGHTDYGSGTGLATTLANLDGTVAVLDVLRPLLSTRMPALSDVDAQIARVRTVLHTGQRRDGSWVPVAQLTTAQRERVNGAVAELTEQLAPIAAITAPRRTS
ncbi:peptidase M75 family protein [Amycolatopsis thermophila]|uniref:Iron uptake system component EfeO n=1 Tax=Amycolatopsis thermophila TaxID=206084 RepID=A0ABU0F2M6_9PSEU|nr:peptidase M75 family protein [Amycolatopsis thermophila]MDQ0381825.1 iron uptake system component EfeO [Amycolatopsis thermophila]